MRLTDETLGCPPRRAIEPELGEELAPFAIRQRPHGTAIRVQHVEDHQRRGEQPAALTRASKSLAERCEVRRAVRRQADQLAIEKQSMPAHAGGKSIEL